jgi:hypothetical protein
LRRHRPPALADSQPKQGGVVVGTFKDDLASLFYFPRVVFE